jgi:hypothetical protein
VLAYYVTSNNLLLFLLVFIQTSLGLNVRLKKDRSRLGLSKSHSGLPSETRKKTRPKEDSFNTKKRPNCD